MIGELEQASSRKHGPVLVAHFLNGTPEPVAIVYTKNGSVKHVSLSDLSVDIHYDETDGKWKLDFPEET